MSDPADEALYFSTPESAVGRIRALLENHEWGTLTRYCDLENTDVDPDRLETGERFFDADADEGHPLTRGWREPFAPAYSYASHSEVGDQAVVEVELEVEEGDGMVTRGVDSFRLRRKPGGWQLVPPEERMSGTGVEEETGAGVEEETGSQSGG